MSGQETKNPSVIIGVRDSGVGGLTVARRIKNLLPQSQLLYFADTAHVPYGDRTPDEVRHYALSISRFLIENGAQILVFACNTSSALALELARQQFELPIIGTIEPGARTALAATQSGRVGVLATRATVETGVYGQWLKRLNPEVEVKEIGCPAFVPLVESEQTETPAAQAAAREYLAPLLEFGADTVVLGCTHYPLLLNALQEAAPEIRFVDPAEAVAAEVREAVETLPGREPAADTFYASGEAEGVAHWIAKLLPGGDAIVERGPVFDFAKPPCPRC